MPFCHRWGRLDILVCAAGVLGEMQLPQDVTEENWCGLGRRVGGLAK